MVSQRFKLENLSCPSCTIHLEAMESREGIARVEANFKHQTMQVRYDEALHTPDAIVRYVAKMGYVAIPVQNVDNDEKEGLRWTKLFHF